MIVYKSTKSGFASDVMTNDIQGVILSNYRNATGKSVGESEIQSWQNSLSYVDRVINDPEIPDTAGVCIEFGIPQSSKRIDFLISGIDAENRSNVVLIELKQWSKAELTEMDAVVKTRFRHGLVETSHPSYQAWSYASLLDSFNSFVYEGNVSIRPCAYCHNYQPDNVLDNERYREHAERAPLFLKPDAIKLRDFIKRFVKYGDQGEVFFKIENGDIRPSKALADSISSMLKGNSEFVMIDDQKIVFENIVEATLNEESDQKKVIIVEGGPGTGKSVVAINLLATLTKHGKTVKYVSKNAAPRAVYEGVLKGDFKKSAISNLFSGSGAFIEAPPNTFDTLIVDEAHRLNEKSGLYSNLGENQVKELINASRVSVFFIDEDQRVTFLDIGSKQEIEKWALSERAAVVHLELQSQFRCSGSDGYLAWLDDALDIRKTANFILSSNEFDFRVYDSPAQLRDVIYSKNHERNKARMVAGYCWSWASKKSAGSYDIEFPQYDFKHRWNLVKDGSTWIVAPESVSEIGCIHTCQGLELDYVGVIIGTDLICRNGNIETNGFAHPGQDKALRGFRKLFKENPEKAKEKAGNIIKNTYRTLMTRGMKGCFIYCEDRELAKYFRALIEPSYNAFS